MKRNILAISVALLAASSFAHAANKTSELKPPAPVQMAVTGGMTLETSFPAAGGMTGWVLSQGVGNNMIVYTPPGGEVIISGNMLDTAGKNLTKEYLEKYAPKPDYTKFWGELEKATWVVEGPKDAKNYIYVFKDANCGFCHYAWKALQPYVAAGLQVRWVPVAFLSADSYEKAGQIMNAKNSSEAVSEMHKNFGKKGAPLPALSKEQRAKIDANNVLMNKWGFQGTPATVYKSAGSVKTVSGMFGMSLLPEITGLPEQPQTDPGLARFK
ncbi:thiol:disulfide interchange protein DsbG [Nostoc sp. CHAB 5834]|nr:thiol:disulfide interchange protein DsbG [Nostoc sp. CHAB 5834]